MTPRTHMRDKQGGKGLACEDEEGGAVGDDAALVVGHAIDDGSHGVLTHTKPEVPLGGGCLLEVAVCLHQGHVAGSQIGGSSHESCTSQILNPEPGSRVPDFPFPLAHAWPSTFLIRTSENIMWW